MFKNIKELFSLLESRQKQKFWWLQVLVVVTAFAELMAVASIAPFMALVGDLSIIEKSGPIADIYTWLGFQSKIDFVFWVGVFVLIMLTIGALISMYTTWRLSMFASKVGSELADRLYLYYMNQPWLFHASSSSSYLTKQIANETTRLTTLVLQPLMQINARIALALFISVAIFLFNPLVAIIGLAIFSLAYLFLYGVVKNKLHINGILISNAYENRYQMMNEGFGGIKDILLLGRQSDLISRFKKSGDSLAYSSGTNNALAHVPRYFMELIAFGAMIGLILYLIVAYSGDLGLVLPVLAVYALAGFKLLPAFQQIYFGVAQIKGNISAFESIKNDLINSSGLEKKPEPAELDNKLSIVESVELQSVCFTYPGKEKPALKKLSLKIPVNSVVGIVGSSGSGKSTAIDVLLALIDPQNGCLKVDGMVINNQNKRAWQNTIGFVPQSIFLSEGTIAENIAFGVPEEVIDLDQVKKALSLAHLDELVNSLEKGIHTKVGERGVQLSGGQRQRIGIARALYHDASVLVFDEATSALDGITEKMIMEAIHDFSGQKTIVMIAHRLKTVQKCDQIFFIDKGQVVDQGTYQELINKNEHFRNMADHA